MVDPSLWRPQPASPVSGWGPAGRGWHPVGERASLRLWQRSPGGSSLVVNLAHRAAADTLLTVDLLLNGNPLETLEVPFGRSQHRLSVPPGQLAEVNEIELAITPEVPLVEGPPILSLLRIGLEGGRAPAPPVSDSAALDLIGKGGLGVDRPGVFLLPLDLPTAAESLQIRVQKRGRGLGSYELFILDVTGDATTVLSASLEVESPTWQVVDVKPWQGRQVTLGWRVEPAIGDRVELLDLYLEGRAGGGATDDSSTTVEAPSSVRPDVILILLDAARGDRFPGWNYPRPTMPFIETLSRRALSFRYAFSECPTTSCSIPALITGVPFLPGGQVGGGLQLADGLTTLAEYLRQEGYRTVGFSATPNNSASRNHDQGFDEFRELWGRGNPDHGPFSMSRLASEVIRDQPADLPLFLQLHYLPPHQPYDPEPEFDRFTDPDYDGPIRPDMSLKPYSLGLQELAGDDLDHLIGLYDGNLSVADAAVRQVVETLEEEGRLDNSLLIITSDHGEAFMEHGRQGHNTTLFDEMLHVPLMVRLPRGEVPGEIDQDRLASVLDIVPTTLALVGVEPRGEVGGIDLLDIPADPRRPRTLFFRTSHPRNYMVAARTPAWKAISWPRSGVQMLFDLARDPGETQNLIGARPLVWASLGLRLRQHLGERLQPELAGHEVEVSDEAEEALRALGYLD